MSVLIAGGDAAAMLAGATLALKAPELEITIWTGPDDGPAPATLLTNPVTAEFSLADPAADAIIAEIAIPVTGARVIRIGRGLAQSETIPGMAWTAISAGMARDRLAELAQKAGCRLVTALPAHVVKNASLILAADPRLLPQLEASEDAFGQCEAPGTRQFAHCELAGVSDAELAFAFARTTAGVFAAMTIPHGKGRASLLLEADTATIAVSGLDDSSKTLKDFVAHNFQPLLAGAEITYVSEWREASNEVADKLVHGRLVLFGDSALRLNQFSGLQTRIGLL